MDNSVIWISDSDAAALCNCDTGRFDAIILHDGFGKYYPTLFLTPPAAFRLWLRDRTAVVKSVYFDLFPRVTVECFRLKCSKMVEAQHMVENVIDAL